MLLDVRKEPGGVMRHSVSREDMILINRLSKTEQIGRASCRERVY